MASTSVEELKDETLFSGLATEQLATALSGETDEAKFAGEAKEEVAEEAPKKKKELKPWQIVGADGSWICSKCNLKNHADDLTCNACFAAPRVRKYLLAKTMRSVVRTASDEFIVRHDFPTPNVADIGEREVVVRFEAVRLTEADLERVAEPIAFTPGRYAVGTIGGMGDSVGGRLFVGARVQLRTEGRCLQCTGCQTQQQDKDKKGKGAAREPCEKPLLFGTGVGTSVGGLAEYAIVSAAHVSRVARAVDAMIFLFTDDVARAMVLANRIPIGAGGEGIIVLGNDTKAVLVAGMLRQRIDSAEAERVAKAEKSRRERQKKSKKARGRTPDGTAAAGGETEEERKQFQKKRSYVILIGLGIDTQLQVAAQEFGVDYAISGDSRKALTRDLDSALTEAGRENFGVLEANRELRVEIAEHRRRIREERDAKRAAKLAAEAAAAGTEESTQALTAAASVTDATDVKSAGEDASADAAPLVKREALPLHIRRVVDLTGNADLINAVIPTLGRSGVLSLASGADVIPEDGSATITLDLLQLIRKNISIDVVRSAGRDLSRNFRERRSQTRNAERLLLKGKLNVTALLGEPFSLEKTASAVAAVKSHGMAAVIVHE
jgi:threonine dehydrogenase-like Zn-dependent dehydrogenase